ncbi:hypothetical protein BKA66DRAFT_426446 [Pyrenochaeta sp. MPI-SDFR-AT-0127]|nr:hypothetical protein BKA66DRAFT_426446 [Pyrenochaeta sp. MPI-SDFR-AT-0127]
MLLFSPRRCDLLLGSTLVKQTALTSRRLSIPLWPASPVSIPLSPRSQQRTPTPSAPPKHRPSPQLAPVNNMSFPASPRSLPFSPTLGSIPEVFEYESLGARVNLPSPHEAQEMPDAFTRDSASIAAPTLTRATSRDAIIQSPLRRTVSTLFISRILRRILEADQLRRRRILRVYLKAIVFLKYMWRANERYGSVMLHSGMYMQR